MDEFAHVEDLLDAAETMARLEEQNAATRIHIEMLDEANTALGEQVIGLMRERDEARAYVEALEARLRRIIAAHAAFQHLPSEQTRDGMSRLCAAVLEEEQAMAEARVLLEPHRALPTADATRPDAGPGAAAPS